MSKTVTKSVKRFQLKRGTHIPTLYLVYVKTERSKAAADAHLLSHKKSKPIKIIIDINYLLNVFKHTIIMYIIRNTAALRFR